MQKRGTKRKAPPGRKTSNRYTKRMTDEWGGIDEKIEGLVRALNTGGIPTTGSCEGHADRGAPAPWAKIGAPENTPADTEALKEKLAGILRAFYATRKTTDEARLVLEDGHAGFWLHNGGEAYHRWREQVEQAAENIRKGRKVTAYVGEKERLERTQNLPRYQEEIRLFAEFLAKLKTATRDQVKFDDINH